MKSRSIAVVVFATLLVGCGAARPPATRISDVGVLAGTYTGSMDERGFAWRQSRLVIHRDGTFEITIGEPKGLRTNGHLLAQPDGSLVYRYGDLKGTGAVYEGGGRRVIVLTQSDGEATITVDTSVP